MADRRKPSFDTRAVHAGTDGRGHFGALSVPIYHASTFELPDFDEGVAIHNEERPGYYYGRLGNPTRSAFESAVAELEGAEASVAFASGMAAVSGLVLSLLRTGDHIVAPASGYSTTVNLFNYLSGHFDINTTFVDASDAANYGAAIRENTKLLWVETPSNPLLNITDIAAVASIACERGIYCIVDNTFATPYNQQPLSLGAQAVVHSATKYLGGHSDVTAGVVAGDAGVVDRIRERAGKYFGGNISPEAAWLILRGIKTLALRMDRHNNNAFAVANMLARQDIVRTVHYPGLPDHRGHDIAARQMKNGFGGILSFELDSLADCKSFIDNLSLCKLATSLGGVETLVQHSASMTHASLDADERKRSGISEGLIRISVGIEDADDICADIDQALQHIRSR